ncbi:MAG: ATP synthase F1 subunit delta [bacterium]
MRVARRYAAAFLETASEEDVKMFLEAGEELKKGRTLFFLSQPFFDIKQKEKFIQSFIPSMSENVKRFLLLLLRKRRISLLPEVIDELVRLKMEREGICEALVSTVIPLQPSERERLQKILECMVGKKVIMKEEIDPSLIGGLTIEVEGNMIDASLKGFLTRLRGKLVERGETRWA